MASFFEDFVYGDVSSTKSQIRFFSPEQNGRLDEFYFYLELRDEQGDFIDRDEHEFVVSDRRGATLPLSLVRIKRGRYYLIVPHVSHQIKAGLKVEIAGSEFKKELIIPTQQVSRKNSEMSIFQKEDHRVILQLVLRDHQGAPWKWRPGLRS